MFDGQNVLTLEGDHLDISYRAQDTWPAMTPAGSIKNYTFGIGDPQVGPLVQLGLVTSMPEEPLDWRHVVDPPHFHGSDQFRVLAGGEWNVGGRPLHAGDYMFQEAGKVYREHPASDDPAWIVLVIGDRRGALPTIMAEADKETLIDGGDNFRAADAENYAHPAGPKGIADVNTSAGGCSRGYLHGSVAALAADAPLHGTFGDANAGPSVELIHAATDETIRPESVCGTEQFLVVTGGSLTIGSDVYLPGDMRVQRAEEPMPALVAGAEGCQLTLVVADRRHQPVDATIG
ncbi:hypothetical protein CRI77_19610 [Mycolicibacterium duvalii]|uniref:Uncharacterized protein n=1 Tax=Mycolicibacterium duvalii TaxID=39688 RepID=A0A7I7JYW6_9MYCO|nr:hypothetical protein [Mycolicibacterium duvalii]PEG37831.1 hypothetical protein CRI77_19610 [Mycolicibacterium duvalii]BBX17045.1 hypothetical protein MDUV_19050 [Mycolicibacterium duvalii]